MSKLTVDNEAEGSEFVSVGDPMQPKPGETLTPPRSTSGRGPKTLDTPGRKEAEKEAAANKRVDEARGPDAPVNLRPTMPYAEAIALRDAGKLARRVLTERGYVTASTSGRIETR